MPAYENFNYIYLLPQRRKPVIRTSIIQGHLERIFLALLFLFHTENEAFCIITSAEGHFRLSMPHFMALERNVMSSNDSL
jgi:hypothetical protein